MGGWIQAVAMSLIMFSMALSGCLLGPDDSANDDSEAVPEAEVELFFEDGEYRCFEHDEEARCWLTHVPEKVNGTELVPLLLDLHGWSLSADKQKELTGFDVLAEEVGAIVLYPQGLAKDGEPALGGSEESWNAGWCCGDAVVHEIDDLGFLLSLIGIAQEIHPVDPSRIYVTGWSNGCAMAHRLAFHASYAIAAMGCMSMYLLDDIGPDYSPIPMMEVHGFIDDVVWYETSARPVFFNPSAWFDNEAYETGAIENLYELAEANNCSGSIPDLSEPGVLYSTQGFTDCENGAEVRLMTIYAGTHNPYQNDFGEPQDWPAYIPGNGGLIPTEEIVWDFLSQFSKAEPCVDCDPE